MATPPRKDRAAQAPKGQRCDHRNAAPNRRATATVCPDCGAQRYGDTAWYMPVRARV